MGDIAKGPKEEASLMKPSPEMYVEAAMSKCTSGVHYGYLSHEVMGLILENLLDIVPQDIPQKWFSGIYKKKARTSGAKKNL